MSPRRNTDDHTCKWLEDADDGTDISPHTSSTASQDATVLYRGKTYPKEFHVGGMVFKKHLATPIFQDLVNLYRNGPSPDTESSLTDSIIADPTLSRSQRNKRLRKAEKEDRKRTGGLAKKMIADWEAAEKDTEEQGAKEPNSQATSPGQHTQPPQHCEPIQSLQPTEPTQPTQHTGQAELKEG